MPDVAALDASQKVVYDSIFATQGNIDGPFLAWMHSPELASRAEKLCAFFRYQSSLELIESELLILCVAIISIAWKSNKSMNQSPVLQDLG